MPTLQIGKTTPSVNGVAIVFPDGISAQDVQDKINAAADAANGNLFDRGAYLSKNFFYGGQGDLQRPNGWAAADADIHGSTNGRPNFDPNGTAGAAYLYGAASAINKMDVQPMLEAAGAVNWLSSNPDHSGFFELPQGRTEQILAGYNDARTGAIAPDGSTPQSRIDAINARNGQNLSDFAASKGQQAVDGVANAFHSAVNSISSALGGLSNGQHGDTNAAPGAGAGANVDTKSAPSSQPLQGDFPAPSSGPVASLLSAGTSNSAGLTSDLLADNTSSSATRQTPLSGAGRQDEDPSSDTTPDADVSASQQSAATSSGTAQDTDTNDPQEGDASGTQAAAASPDSDDDDLTDQDVAELTPDFASWNMVLNDPGLQDA